jgi:PAS domain S-box-containing protein
LTVTNASTDSTWKKLIALCPQFKPESLLIAPLEIDYGRVEGFIMFTHQRPDAFSKQQVELARQMRTKTAAILKKIFLLQDTRDAFKESQVLLDANRELFVTVELEAVYKTMAQAFIATGADRCTLGTFVEFDEENVPTRSQIAAIRAKASIERELNISALVGQQYDMRQYPYLFSCFYSRDILNITDIPNHPDLNDDERHYLTQIGAETVTIVPLFSFSKAAPLGYFFVEHLEPYTFSARELALYRTIANQTTMAIENAQQIAQTRQRARQIQTGAEISKITSTILNEEKLIDQAVNLMKDGFGFYYVGIFLVDKVGEWAILKAGTGPEGEAQLEAKHRLAVDERSMIGWSITHRKARIALDVGKDAVRFVNPFLPLTRSEMALPLISRHIAIGGLTVQSELAGAFSDDDIATLQIMADQLANAILNSRLYHSLELSSQELSTLVGINRDISASIELDKLLDLIITKATMVVNGDQGTIFMLDGDTLVPRAAVGDFAEQILTFRPQVGRGFSGLAAQTRKTVVQQVEVPDKAVQIPDTPAVPEAVVAVPIQTETKLLGVLLIRRLDATQEFSQTEVSLVEGIALQAAIAIENANLLTATQQAHQETQLLYQMSRQLSSVERIQAAAQILIQHISKDLFDRIEIALKEEPDNRQNTWLKCISVWDRAGQEEDFLDKRYSPVQIPLISAASQEESIIISNFNDHPLVDERTKTIFTEVLGVKSVVILPLRMGRKFLGWFLGQTTSQSKTFAEVNITPLMAMVDQLAGTIDRIQKTESLLEAGQRFSTIVDNIPGVVYRGRLDGGHIFTYISDDIFDITGYPVERFSEDGDLTISDIIHPDDQEKAYPAIERQLQDEQTYLLQYRIIDKKGQIRHISDRGRGVFDQGGNLLYVDGIMFDVTERLILEEAVRRRATQFEAVAQVGQSASAILDVDRLLTETVDLICENFGFYYAGLFLLDSKNEWAVLHAGFGEPGRKMLEEKHRLRRDEDSMVGWATYHEKPRVALDVSREKHRFDNPHLPLTRSEIALPLVARGKVIGALDVQSVEENAFSEEDIATLQIMANQLANVIENARLFEGTQKNLSQTNLLYQTTQKLLASQTEKDLFKSFIEAMSQLNVDSVSLNVYCGSEENRCFEVKEIWDRQGKAVYQTGSRFDVNSSSLSQMLAQNKPIIVKDTASEPALVGPSGQQVIQEGVYALVGLPIFRQDENLGVVVITSKTPNKTFSDEDVRFFESMIQQLTITWQNLRLLTSVERGFRRERIIRELTSKIHATVGIENILETTVTELTKALDTSGGVARLGISKKTQKRSPEITPTDKNNGSSA